MDFIEVIKNRRSVRNFSSRSVSDEIIKEFLFLIPIWYANEEPKEIYRKPYEEIVFYNKFDDTNIVSDF